MKKTIITLIGLIIVVILLLTTQVLADSFKLVVTSNKTQLHAGEEVTLELGIADVEVGDLGINAVEAVLSYDESVFEKVTQDDFTPENNWTFAYNDKNNEQKGKMLAMILSSGEKENQKIGKITLRVKKDVKGTDTTISIRDIATNNGEDLVTCKNQDISFTVEGGKTGNSTMTSIAPVIICLLVMVIVIIIKRIKTK